MDNFDFAFEQACNRLTHFVIGKAERLARSLNISFEDKLSAPESFEEVKKEFETSLKTGKVFRVFSGASDKVIYSNYHGNICFRFWHDYVHYSKSLGFDTDSELIVGEYQVNEVKKEFGNKSMEAKLMQADTIGQVKYQAKHGHFVENQKVFARAYVKMLQSFEGV